MTPIDAFLDELLRPSNAEPGPIHAAYERAVVGIGHLVVGAAVGGVLLPVVDLADAVARLALGGTYWAVKEWGDLRRGGSMRDGIEDATLVSLGLFYAGQWFAPGAALLIGGYLMWRGVRK